MGEHDAGRSGRVEGTEVAQMRTPRKSRHWKHPEERADVYRAFDEHGTLLYVGTSVSAINRLIEHRSNSGWYDGFATLTKISYPSPHEAFAAEQEALATENPRFNIRRGVVREVIPQAGWTDEDWQFYTDVPRAIKAYRAKYNLMSADECEEVICRSNTRLDLRAPGFKVRLDIDGGYIPDLADMLDILECEHNSRILDDQGRPAELPFTDSRVAHLECADAA